MTTTINITLNDFYCLYWPATHTKTVPDPR